MGGLPDPALVLRIGLEAVALLGASDLGIDRDGLHYMALIEHRLRVQQIRLIEGEIEWKQLEAEAPFRDLDTSDNPYQSQDLMSALCRFATDCVKAGPEKRLQIRDALLAAHRASIIQVQAVEGEVPLSNVEQALARLTINKP